MKTPKTCYRCDDPATTREHYPPKCFFPKGAGLQLKTVPSCARHNNAKSGADQYLLAHIVMNASRTENLAQRIFLRSIAPQLEQSEGFRKRLFERSKPLPGGARMYPVDVKKTDEVFDSICYAIYFDRYGTKLDTNTHKIRHIYLNLSSTDAQKNERDRQMFTMMSDLIEKHRWMVSHYEADKVDEAVYGYKIVDPAGPSASITIAHTFYGVFNVVSLLTRYVGASMDMTKFAR